MAPLPRRLHVVVGTGLLGASLTLGCTDERARVNEGPEKSSDAEPQPEPLPNVNPGPEPEPPPEPEPKPVEPVRVNTRPEFDREPPEPIEPVHVNEGPQDIPAPVEPTKAPPDTKVNPGPTVPAPSKPVG